MKRTFDKTQIRAYVVALLAVAVAVFLRWELDRVVEADRYVLSIFAVPVVLAAWLGGLGPALFAATLGWLAATLILGFDFNLTTDQLLGTFIFWFVCIAIALISGRMHALKRRAENAAQETAVRKDVLEKVVEHQKHELEKALQRLQFSDRVSLMGTLAAGIGHDLGNLLFPICSRLDSLEDTLHRSGMNCEDVENIRSAANYLQVLSRNLSRLVADPVAGQGGDSTRLADWWPDTASLLKLSLPRGVKLGASIPPDLPEVRIAPHALTQVVFNLVQNAGKAMAHRRHGQITVEADFDPQIRRVALSIADNGPGLPQNVLQRLNQRSITPTEQARGTGLGLVLVQTITVSVGGSATFESMPGRGTTVRLTLPIVQEHSSTEINAGALADHALRTNREQRN